MKKLSSEVQDVDRCPIDDCEKVEAQNVPGPPRVPGQWFCVNHRHLAAKWNREHPPQRVSEAALERVWIDKTSLKRGHGYIYPMNPDNADWDEAPIEYSRVRKGGSDA